MEACPKCTFTLLPEAVECPACGVILAKLKAVSGMPRPALALASNPYAPPESPVEGLSIPAPVPAAPAHEVITRPTVEAFTAMRPWMRFFAVFGLAINAITLLAALGMLFWSNDRPGLMPIAFIYFAAAGVGFAILFPLNRSTVALGGLAAQGASGSLESFALEQATFWRRLGAICVAYLIIIVVFVVLGGVGALTSR